MRSQKYYDFICETRAESPQLFIRAKATQKARLAETQRDDEEADGTPTKIDKKKKGDDAKGIKGLLKKTKHNSGTTPFDPCFWQC